MKIRILGAGVYGCHIASSLIDDGHDVTIFEIKDRIFGGASGNIPARAHLGFHYSRSKKTREACQKHIPQFMAVYHRFTRMIPTNIYAIAENSSLVDYDQYVDTLTGEVPFIEIEPSEYGLEHCEGAILTQERHIVTDDMRAYFEQKLAGRIRFNTPIGLVDDPDYDLNIDCTFCAHENAGIDRYEPCVVGILRGPTNFSLTVMDGPFGSVYPWNEANNFNSLSSAKWTPFSKDCKTYEDANQILMSLSMDEQLEQLDRMFADLEYFFPALANYEIVAPRLSIRAMPLSGADSRLVDVVEVGEKAVRVRAGKIDAVVHAEQIIKERYIK